MAISPRSMLHCGGVYFGIDDDVMQSAELLTLRIEREYAYFYKKWQTPPNTLLLHPKLNWQLREELFAKGIMMYATEREEKVPAYHGMNIYLSADAGDFRIGWMME